MNYVCTSNYTERMRQKNREREREEREKSVVSVKEQLCEAKKWKINPIMTRHNQPTMTTTPASSFMINSIIIIIDQLRFTSCGYVVFSLCLLVGTEAVVESSEFVSSSESSS